MLETIHVTGTLTNDHTVHLDQTVPMGSGPLRIVVEVSANQEIPSATKESMAEFRARIRAEQNARGHVSRTVEEINAQINEERNSWDRQ
jgi:hypothetical protein